MTILFYMMHIIAFKLTQLRVDIRALKLENLKSKGVIGVVLDKDNCLVSIRPCRTAGDVRGQVVGELTCPHRLNQRTMLWCKNYAKLGQR